MTWSLKIILFVTDSDICPVKIFKLYLRKLNSTVDILWQRPKTKINDYDQEWFDAIPVGRDPLNTTMKTLSKNAGLSTMYTNHCIRASVVTNLNEKGFEARDIMATTGHKSESSIRSYATKVPTKRRREMSDALASKMGENTAKKQKKEVSSTVSAPPKSVDQDYNSMITFELFPDFEDADLVKVLTEIENESQSKEMPENTKDDQQKENQVAIKSPKTPKTVNFSSSIANISNVSRTPMLPHMYFPHSNVTINYNINQ